MRFTVRTLRRLRRLTHKNVNKENRLKANVKILVVKSLSSEASFSNRSYGQSEFLTVFQDMFESTF